MAFIKIHIKEFNRVIGVLNARGREYTHEIQGQFGVIYGSDDLILEALYILGALNLLTICAQFKRNGDRKAWIQHFIETLESMAYPIDPCQTNDENGDNLI